MLVRILAALLAAFALPLAAPSLAQAPEFTPLAEAESPWPFAQSDLPPDPSYRTGVLDNGMRYIIRPNATPPEQGMVQLWVDFGSVAEAEDQRGWAHFIEHMAFNGSTNLPEGEMVRLLEREGLAFGADTNASTGFDTTRYMLNLPRNDMDLLDTALMLMRETASELTFAEDAVEREKGVILSERRVRDTYQLRSALDSLEFFYPQSRLSQRLPIGTEETISNATGSAMRDLWQTWYRPENVALIVVGDYDAAAVEAAIAEHFADWQAPERPAPPAFGPFAFDRAGETDIFLDPALSEQVTVARVAPWQGGPDTVASRRQRLERQIGYDIINRRLQRLTRLDDPPFRGAGLGTAELYKEARTTQLVVYAADGEWPRALAAAQEEYRRALQFGFTEAEVAEQIANYRSAIEANAAGADTRPNNSFITGAITLLRDGQVPTTPESALERFNAHAPTITPEAVMAALREELVPLQNPLIRFEGRTAPEGGEAALRAAWIEGTEGELVPDEQAAMAEFAYTDFGTPGTIVSDTVDERLDIRTITFANGLKLNLKPTELQQDRIQVQLHVDGGEMLNTPDNPLATAMTGSLPSGGLGAHTLDELQSILAGKQVSFNVGAAGETFRLGAGTTPGDLELQLQLLAAAFADPAFRPAAEAQYRRSVDAYFAQLYATPSSAFSAEIGSIVSDGDPRHSLQPQEAYRALSFAKLREDIIERWNNGAMELAIVGDFDPEQAIELVAATLGALPAREEAFRPYPENRQRSFTADRTPRRIYHDGPDDQAMVVMVWPTRDDSDHRENLTLELLERVLQIRLIDTLREELGQTYSPGADADQSSIHPGYGTFDISAAVDLADVDAARAAMLEALEEIRTRPVDADVLLRARQPALEAFDNALDTNRGWMNLVDRAQTEPERIDRFLAGRDLLASLTAEDVQAVAERYLDPAERLEILVLPQVAKDASAL